MSKIIGYRMLTPGSTRGAVSDTFYRWTSGQEFTCPGVPAGEFAHLDPAHCITITGEAKAAAPDVKAASIDPSDIETRPAAAKRTRAKK